MSNLSKSFYQLAFILLLIIIAGFLWMSPHGHEGDLQCWVRWAKSVRDTGIGYAYTNDEIVYHPFYLWMLYGYGKLFPSDYGIEYNLQFLKASIFIFDVLGILVLAWFLNKNKISAWKSLLVLICPAYFYNTLIWGQVDSIYTAFCFASVILALSNKPVLSLISFILGFSMKFQAIVFAPVLIILLFPVFIENKNVFLKGFFYSLLTLLFVLFPFIYRGQLMNLWKVITCAINFFPVVSMRGDNIWYLLLSNKDLVHFPDTTKFLGVTYKNWGLILYFAGTVLILFPIRKLIREIFKLKSGKIFSIDEKKIILLAGTLLPLVFFFFNTQMHERYAHAAVIFSGAFALLSRKYFLFLIVSAAVMLNEDVVIHGLNMPEKWYANIPFYNEQVIAGIYLVALIYGFRSLYSSAKKLNAPLTS